MNAAHHQRTLHSGKVLNVSPVSKFTLTPKTESRFDVQSNSKCVKDLINKGNSIDQLKSVQSASSSKGKEPVAEFMLDQPKDLLRTMNPANR